MCEEIIMDKIIKGTTPTIKYTFMTIAVSDVTAAYLTITDGSNTIEKDISTADVTSTSIGWTLSQAETLSLTSSMVTVRLNWKTNDGTRGASERAYVTVESNELDEVI